MNTIKIAAYRVISHKARRFFEGESSPNNPGNQNVQSPPPGQADPNAPQPNGDQPQNTPAATAALKYTEADFNRLVNQKVGDARRTAIEQNKKTVEQLQALQKNQQLSEEQKQNLQLQIEELQATYRTAEEVKRTEIEKLTKKYDSDTTKLKEESSAWRNRFENNMISVDINRAAIKYKAVSPEQIEAVLRPSTRVTEELDAAGKPTGNFVSKVKFRDVDGEGKPVELDLDTDAAVKTMSERPTRFGNLFNNATNGGTGQSPNTLPMGNGTFDLERMSPEEYRKNRGAIHAQMRAGKK